MKAQTAIQKIYRLFYVLGVAMLIASIALVWPARWNQIPVRADDWSVSASCSGITVRESSGHGDVSVKVRLKDMATGLVTTLLDADVPAGGSYEFSRTFSPPLVGSIEYIVFVIDNDTVQFIFNFKQAFECGPVTETVTVTPPTETVTVTPPTETVTVTPPTETVTVTPPTETVTVTPPTETVTVTPPTETVTVTPPTETVTVTPPTETVTVTPPTETVTVTPPTETVTVTPPTETVTVTPPTETVTVTPPTETVTVTPPTETVTVVPPTETVTPRRDPPRKNDRGTPIAAIPSPVGTPGVLIAVTGAGGAMPFDFMQRGLFNLGFAFFGLALVLHGLSIRSKR